MFERFTKDARQVVTGAVAEAERSGDRRVGTDHMLLGVASLGSIGVDAVDLRETRARLEQEALAAVGIEPEPIRAFTEPEGPRRRGGTHLPFTGGAKDTLKGALREATELRHRHIGVEHIALALTTREDRGPCDPLDARRGHRPVCTAPVASRGGAPGFLTGRAGRSEKEGSGGFRPPDRC